MSGKFESIWLTVSGVSDKFVYGLPTSSGGDGQHIVEQASGEGYASLFWHPLEREEKRRYTSEQKVTSLLRKGVSVMPISYYAARANLYYLWRQHPDWSHAELAAAVGCSTSWVEKWLKRLKEQLTQANARIKELEDRLAKDSRTSSKPPSSDGLARLPRSARRPSGKRPGGQAGHPGHTLSLVEQPDEVVRHRPKVCSQCREDLSAVPGSVAERRQVLDVPEIRLLAQEHQIEAICCPTCHTTSLGSFPASVSAPVQYGPQPAGVGRVSAPGAIAANSSHLRGARGALWVPDRGSHLAAVE